MRSKLRQGRISLLGIAFMIIGLGAVIFEMQTALLLARGGIAGRVAIFVCGTGFSVWGLKEVIADLLPGLTKTTYRFKLPIEGWVYLLIMIVMFAASLIGRNNMLMMVFSCLIGPWVMNGWFTFTMLRKLKISRLIPDRVMAGEAFTTSIVMENRKSWLSVWLMQAQDTITNGVEVIRPEILFVHIPSGQKRQGHYQIQLNDRGRYLVGPVRVTTRFPLGLLERGTQFEVLDEIAVYPRTGYLKPEWRRILQDSTELVSDVRTMPGPFHDEMSRIREYRHGDDPRMIHWRTSARTNELMVCEYEESRDRDLLIIIDGWLAENASETLREDFERGLRFATTICMDHLRSSRESSLIVKLDAHERMQWRGDRGESHVEQLLDAFAETTPTQAIPTSDLFSGLEELQTAKQRIVIITGRPDQVAQQIQLTTDTRLLDAQIFGNSASGLSMIYEEGG